MTLHTEGTSSTVSWEGFIFSIFLFLNPKHDHSGVRVSMMRQLSNKAHWVRLRSPLWESSKHFPTAYEEIRTGVTLNNKEGPRQSGAVDTADCNWNSVYAAVWNAPLTSSHAPQNEKEVPLFARFRPSIHISIIFQTEWQTSRKEETCRLWKPAVNGPATLLLNEPTVSLSSAVKKH